MIDVAKAALLVSELAEIEVGLLDREPPRGKQRPNLDELKARQKAVRAQLRVKRNYTTAKGHDLDGSGRDAGFDLTAVGIVESIREKADRVGATVGVVFLDAAREHLWFAPEDLEPAP